MSSATDFESFVTGGRHSAAPNVTEVRLSKHKQLRSLKHQKEMIDV